MSVSRRVLESVSRPYSAAVLDAAVEREARGGGGSVSSPVPTSVAEPYREAHLESVSSRRAPSTVRASALERLGAHLAADENFGRKLSKDAVRALNGVDYLSDREKHLLGALDKRAWAALVEASDKFKVAVGKNEAAGVPAGPSLLGDYLDGFKLGGGGAAYGWGDVTTPSSPGITLGSGKTVGGHVGGAANTSTALGGGDDGGRSGGAGHFGNFGAYTAHGDAGDPRSPTGGTLGERPDGRGGGGSQFKGSVDRYTGIAMHGDPYGGGGISGGNLPSRAVLSGAAWKALSPGREISDEPKQPPKDPKEPAKDPQPPPRSEGEEWGAKVGIVGGAALGAVEGGLWGAAIGAVAGGIAGHFLGGAYERWKQSHTPADTDLTGGTGGPHGPRARMLVRGQYYLPADDGSTTGPVGPRSGVLRSLRSAAFYFPSEDATGSSPGPRSRSAAEGGLYMPNPDDPRPGDPHSRALAAAGIIPY